MKTSLALTCLMTALASSKPLDERYFVTTTDAVTVTQTITGGEHASTDVPTEVATTLSTGHRHSHSHSYSRSWGEGSEVASSETSSAASSAASSSVSLAVSSFSTPEAHSTLTLTISTTAAAQPSSTTEVSTIVPSSSTESTVVPSTLSKTSSTPISSSTSSCELGTTDGYALAVLAQHNNHRANHSAPCVTWSDSLTATAQKIAASCVYAHNTGADGGGYGQNIGAGSAPSEVPALITNLMYNGEMTYYAGLYGKSDPDMTDFEKWGHFSQIVWYSTTQIGCYTQKCDSLTNVDRNGAPYFTVCNYSPPGNCAGQYGKNVLEPLGDATVAV